MFGTRGTWDFARGNSPALNVAHVVGGIVVDGYVLLHRRLGLAKVLAAVNVPHEAHLAEGVPEYRRGEVLRGLEEVGLAQGDREVVVDYTHRLLAEPPHLGDAVPWHYADPGLLAQYAKVLVAVVVVHLMVLRAPGYRSSLAPQHLVYRRRIRLVGEEEHLDLVLLLR
jgi:hypothetical protein